MAGSRIDREKLRVQVHRLRREQLLHVLDRAIDLLPKTRLGQLIDGYIDPEEVRADGASAGSLVKAVTAFRDASLDSEYYDSFDVNSRNFMEKSSGTEVWIAECKRLLARCVAVAGEGGHAAAGESFEMIFGLLRHIDEGHDDIVFFADEGGSWQVGVDWREVLPAWFTCLAQTAGAEDYARTISSTIDDFVSYDRRWFLRKARSSANPAQKKALGRGRK